MPRESAGQASRVALGRQFAISGGGTVDTIDAATLLADGVARAAVQTYKYQIPVRGASKVEVTLKPSAITGSITPSIYKTLADGVTQKSTAVDFAALVDETLQTARIDDLCGEAFIMLEIPVGSSESVTFSVAEVSRL